MIKRFSLISLLFLLLQTVSAQINVANRIDGSPYPVSAIPSTIYVINDWGWSEAKRFTTSTLMGLLAKSGNTMLYNESGVGYATWLNDLVANYGVYKDNSYYNDFTGLITNFQYNFDGYILCNLKDNSSNVAVSLCARYNAIAITSENEALMTKLGKSMLLDVRGKDETWALANYENDFSKDIVCLQDENKCMFLSDYAIFANAFQFFDSNINSTLVSDAFSRMNENRVVMGWGPDEEFTVKKISKNSLQLNAADWTENLPVLSNFEATLQQHTHSTTINEEDNVHTVCFLVSDGDNFDWLLKEFNGQPKAYGSPNRGQVSIGWSISPALSELAPTIMKYLYDKATNTSTVKDYFVGSTSGLGYMNPDLFPSLQASANLTNKFMKKADPVNYNYPQIVTGKPSMWDEAAEQAPYSATWESFFGMQFYAFIDPQTAWDAFDGIMSLVDETGMIGGESLPSRKAQTAWLLYQITKDKTRLAQVYDALERYLNWRLQYPHWIYAGNPETAYPDPTKKDADFAFSAIIDLDYMIKISKVVKDEFIAYEWEDKKINFFDDCLLWFWITPGSRPVQYYNTSTGGRANGNLYWVTKGLHVDLLQNETDYLNSMYSAFSNNFNSDYNFGGISLGYPKYPDMGYTLYGLIDNSKTEKASSLIDVSIRDIVRSGNWLAESYEITDNTATPYPMGVRPSTFGAAMMIDFVMIKNGFRYDFGTPYIQNLFDGARSVKGIRYSNRVLNIESNSEGLFTVSGSYLETPQEIQTQKGEFLPVEGGLVSSKIEKFIKPKVFNKEGGISIKNFGKKIINIYTITGVKIRSFNTSSSILDVNLKSGVYIVQIGRSSNKVVVY